MKKELSTIHNSSAFHFLYILSILMWFAFPLTNVMGQPPKRTASPVVVEKVIKKHVRPIVTLIGTAEPHRRSIVAPQVQGLVKDFPVRKGQKIAGGDVLVRIEKQPLLLQLKAARANLAEAKENHKNALSELKRTTDLYKKKSVSDRAYDDALYRANALKKKIMALEARIEAIQYDMKKCTIRAPFAGFVVKEHTQLGQWLKEGGEVVTIVEIDPIVVTIPVPDRYIHFLKAGQEVDLEFDFLPGSKKRRGLVRDIIPEGNERSRTFPVQIRVANKDLSILAGMSSKVRFPVGTPEEALLVDKDAVVTTGNGHQVFVVRHGKAVPVEVKKGPAYGGLVVVEGNLSAGDMVVIEGNERLRSGQEVQTKMRQSG